MGDDTSPSRARTRSGAGRTSSPTLDTIQTTAANLNLPLPVTQMSADLNQCRGEVKPTTALWIRVEKDDLKKLKRKNEANGWELMVVTGTVSDQSELKVNVKFSKKSDDQEFGIVLSPGTAWENYSYILSEAASAARVARTKDKSHGHNKLEKIALGQAYQTTNVEVAGKDVEQVSKDALDLVKKSGTKDYHVIDGTVVLPDNQTASTPATDLSNMGAHGPAPTPPHPQPSPAHLQPQPIFPFNLLQT